MNCIRKFFFVLIFIIGCSVEKDGDTFTYTPFSQSVIHVNFQHAVMDSLSISTIVLTNIPQDGELNTVTVAKEEDHYLNIEIDRPSKIFLNLNDNQYNVFVFPQDTTHIKIDMARDKIDLSFYGKAKLMNEYYWKKKNDLGYADTRIPLNKSLSPKTTYNSLKQSADSVINRELEFLEKYSSRDLLPEWFLDYERSEIKYIGVGYKTTMPHANEIMKYFKDTIPKDYFDFLSYIEVDNPKAVLSSAYFLFLDDYFLKSLPVNEFDQLTGFSRINKTTSYQLNQSKKQLSGYTKELYHKSSFSSMIKFYSDSLAIDSVAKAFQLSGYNELVWMAGTKSRNEIQILNMNKGDTIPDFILVNNLDSLISIRAFREQVLYLNFWATWCGPCIQNMPELNKMIVKYENNPNVKFLNICVDSERDKWLAGIVKHKLKGVNLMAEGNWNSKVRAYFNIKGIPHYAILNKGNILFENGTDKAPSVQHKIDAILIKR